MNRLKSYKQSQGFTIVELIIVILIVTVMAAFVFGSYSNNSITLEAQAQQVARDIEFTQALAMDTSAYWGLIKFSANSYSIRNPANSASPPLWPGAIALPSGVNFSSGAKSIYFNGLGVPYTNANFTNKYANDIVITLRHGSQTRTVTVTPETGRVVVS